MPSPCRVLIQAVALGAVLTEYSKPVSAWLEEWPAEQLHVIQYERLTDDAQQLESLRNLTAFLGGGQAAQ